MDSLFLFSRHVLISWSPSQCPRSLRAIALGRVTSPMLVPLLSLQGHLFVAQKHRGISSKSSTNK